VSDPGVAATTNTVNNQFSTFATDYPTLIEWLNFRAGDPNTPTDPTGTMVRIPPWNDGETPQAYADRLTALGLQPTVETAAQFDPSFDEDAIIYTDPVTGSEVRIGGPVKIWTNPKLDHAASACDTATPHPDDVFSSDGWTPASSAQYLVVSDYTQDWNGFTTNNGIFQAEHEDETPYTTYVRHGRVKLDSFGDPEGWGYRYIVYAHGWDANTEARTVEALTHVPLKHVVADEPGSGDYHIYDYVGQQYTVDSEGTTHHCVQVVRATDDVDINEVNLGLPSKGIIDSVGVLVAGP
jgi:hypothetical protein